MCFCFFKIKKEKTARDLSALVFLGFCVSGIYTIIEEFYLVALSA